MTSIPSEPACGASLGIFPPRRGQSAQANMAGLSGWRQRVFLAGAHAHALVSSPTYRAAATTMPSTSAWAVSTGTLPPRRGQSAQANMAGLSGCRHRVFFASTPAPEHSLVYAAAATMAPLNSALAVPATLPTRRGQSAQANMAGLSGWRQRAFLAAAVSPPQLSLTKVAAVAISAPSSSVWAADVALPTRRGQSAHANMAGLSGWRHRAFFPGNSAPAQAPAWAAAVISCPPQPTAPVPVRFARCPARRPRSTAAARPVAAAATAAATGVTTVVARAGGAAAGGAAGATPARAALRMCKSLPGVAKATRAARGSTSAAAPAPAAKAAGRRPCWSC
mmetsp:Transcript_113590/g.355229  ORF Transcript_113590/g.355229 Transcript_113590/m.355229 type:complete len:336 (+) Transcript_113590:83-1090(+)